MIEAIKRINRRAAATGEQGLDDVEDLAPGIWSAIWGEVGVILRLNPDGTVDEWVDVAGPDDMPAGAPNHLRHESVDAWERATFDIMDEIARIEEERKTR